MQKTIHYLLLTTSLLAAACGTQTPGNKELAAKKEALGKLKGEQDALNQKVANLEKEISKLDSSATTEKPKLVTLTPAALSSFTHYIDLQGRVDALNISYIAPRNGQGGIVKQLFVKKGDQVKKGQLLLKLDDVIATQNVNAVQQNLAALKAQLDLSQDLYKRRQNLWSQGIGSEVDVLTAKTSADNLDRQYHALQANLNAAEEQLKFTSVYSDVDGVADDVNIRVGEMFTGVTAAGSQIKIVNTSNLKVVTQVPENYLGRVNVGSHIILSFPDINKTIDAAVTVASPLIDNNSRSFYIEAKIPSGKEFHPNQLVKVQIRDYNAPAAMTVPINTLQSDDKGKFVLVAVQENNKLVARKKMVQSGEFYNDTIEIKSGLQAGDMVITDGFQGLYDGQAVTTGTNK